MTKADLRTGMIVTTRNGIEYTVFLGSVYESEGDKDLLCNGTKRNWMPLSFYDENLDYNRCVENDNAFDIVKVEKAYHPYSFMDLEYRREDRILLWRRPVFIKMTLEEVIKLAEKFLENKTKIEIVK